MQYRAKYLSNMRSTAIRIAALVVSAGCATTSGVGEEACAVSGAHRVEAAYLQQNRLVIALDNEPLHIAASLRDEPTGLIESLSVGEWDALRAGGDRVSVRGARAWRKMLHGACRSLAPEGAGQGCAIDILKREELFVYLDRGGALHTVPLVNKPPAISIVRSYRFRDLIAALPTHRTAALYVTGESGYPLVFAGPERVVFLANSAEPARQRGKTGRLLSTTLGGHLKAMANQPVTSMARFFTMAANSTKDLATFEPHFLMKRKPSSAIVERDGMDLEQWEAELDRMTGSVASSGRLRHLRDGSAVQARTVANAWFAGDHTKAIVVDEHTAFVGGMNIGREYRYDWHDLMVELKGPVVSAISAEFESAWAGSKSFSDFRSRKAPAGKVRATASDMDNLSLRVNREMNLATSHAPAVRALMERVFEPDMEHATELTEPVPTDWSHFFAELVADGM